MSNVLPFDVTFVATDMSINEVREIAREKGWPGVHIDMNGYRLTGVLVVKRLTRKVAYNVI